MNIFAKFLSPVNNLWLFVLVGIFFCGVSEIKSQTTGDVPPWVRINEEKRREMDKTAGRDQNGMIIQNKEKISVEDVYASKEEAVKENVYRDSVLKEINDTFSVPDAYSKPYANFLNKKNTGIIRLFPDIGCGQGRTADVKELERCAKTPPIEGAGSRYSFRLQQIPNFYPLKLILSYVGSSEIHYVADQLEVGTSSVQSVIVELGAVDFDEITVKSAGVKELNALKPDKNAAQFAERRRNLASGISVGSVKFSSAAKIKLDETMALRSISYLPSKYPYPTFWNKDSLLILKPVARLDDGSVVFLWKKIRERGSPVLND